MTVRQVLVAFTFTLFGCQKEKVTTPDPEPVCQVTLSRGLIAYYPFNGNFNDESGNANHATPMNGASLGTDMIGRTSSAAKFDGFNDYLIVKGSSKLDADSISISVNVMVNSVGRKQTLVNRVKFQDATAMQWGIGQPLPSDNTFSFAVPEKAEACTKQAEYVPANGANSTVLTLPGRWYNIVSTFGKSGQKIYVDGKLVKTLTRTFNSLKKCSDADLLLGGWWSGEIISLDGKMDDVRIYNRELSTCEIEKLAEDVNDETKNKPICESDLAKGLLAYYPFKGNFLDASGNGNDASPFNGALLSTDMVGRQSSAARFSGNAYLRVPGSSKLDADSISVSLQVMVNTINRRHTLVNRLNFSDATGFQWGVGQALANRNQYSFAVPPTSEACSNQSVYDSNNEVVSSVVTEPGRWYNLVCTFSKTGQKIYIDGKLISSINRSFATVKKCTNADLLIGGWWSGDPIGLDGKIDEVRVYNRVLSECEIKQLAVAFIE